MTVWMVAAVAVAAPFAARALARVHRPHRGLVLLGHLAQAALWGWLAFAAGAPRPTHPGVDRSAVLLVLAAGLLWVEGWFVFGLPARRIGAAGSRASGENGSGPRGGAAENGGARELLGSGDRTGDEGGGPGEDNGPEWLPPHAEALLRRIQRLDSVPVEEIMTPRERIVFGEVTDSIARTLERMRAAGHTRLLVVTGGSLDRVLGVVHARDLVPLAVERDPARAVRPHLRRLLLIPERQTVARLIEDFRRDRVHVGVVADPRGRTLGLVTLGDVLRHIAEAARTEETRRAGP